MNRLVEFSDRHQLALELAYYPPYHSKYNLIERCWGILENHWNGTLLTSIQTALEWAKTMAWRGVAPIVHLMDRVYETGVRILPRDFRPIAARLERSTTPPEMEPHHQSPNPGRLFPAGCLSSLSGHCWETRPQAQSPEDFVRRVD